MPGSAAGLRDQSIVQYRLFLSRVQIQLIILLTNTDSLLNHFNNKFRG